jgi:ribosomal-protein-alanine N-acetyltransferase
MAQQPTWTSDRLVLRPFAMTDAPDVQRLAGDRAVASTTLNIPHPYEDGAAEAWIASHQEGFDSGKQVTIAITLRDGTLIGAIGLHVNQEHRRAELGYWIGKPYWGNGYCTEAAEAVLRYGFETLGLNRIHARHLARNPASGRVMQKIGMRHEGYLRQHAKKWGVFEDVELYAILKNEYVSQHSQ